MAWPLPQEEVIDNPRITIRSVRAVVAEPLASAGFVTMRAPPVRLRPAGPAWHRCVRPAHEPAPLRRSAVPDPVSAAPDARRPRDRLQRPGFPSPARKTPRYP